MDLTPAPGQEWQRHRGRLAGEEGGGADLGPVDIAALLGQDLDRDSPCVAPCREHDLDLPGLPHIQCLGQVDFHFQTPPRQGQQRVHAEGDQDQRPEIEAELPQGRIEDHQQEGERHPQREKQYGPAGRPDHRGAAT
jgi:hypothetical protein